MREPDEQPAAAAATPVAGAAGPRITAYHASVEGQELLKIVPAPRWRDWMNATTDRFANRCLPLLVANESGWVLLNPIEFEATWTGGIDKADVTIEFAGEVPPQVKPVTSNFGHGIVTWTLPYLFRTPPGWNLLARGPANWPKDGVCALEGLVETDWAVATFTMNWKFTRPGHSVRFEEDEPFCMVVPQRRGELESFDPGILHVRADRETAAGWQQWLQERDSLQVRKFLGEYSDEYESYRGAWQSDYFRGKGPNGGVAPEHETKRRLPRFAPRD